MTDDKEPTPPRSGLNKDEVALELMKFVAATTGYGKSAGGAGFGGKAPKTPDEQVDALLALFSRCKTLIGE